MLHIVDLGANDGCSIVKFEKMLHHNKITNYRIYSFEPNPFFKDILQKKEKNNIKIFHKMAGTKNKLSQLYLSQHGNDGSSIYSDKTTNGVSKELYVNVEEIDINEFIELLPNDEELWVKMDIEGAEYDIIPHLHNNNSLKKINKLYIEWHNEKIPSITNEKHKKTLEMVKNIKVYDWDAMNYRLNLNEDYKSFIKSIKY